MTTSEIWSTFAAKLQADSLSADDFADGMRAFLQPWLCGAAAKRRRENFLTAPARFIDGERVHSVILTCPDDEYRLDFDEKCRLCFVECITLPLTDINFPLTEFQPLPEKEAWIRAEQSITKTVYLYAKLRDQFGAETARVWFLDGAGDALCAKSWVPFYAPHKAWALYRAWIENRISGENVSVDEFGDDRCVLRLIKHLWFAVYDAAGHLKPQIAPDEYRVLFEHIWHDRAAAAGWDVEFAYDRGDTSLTLTRMCVSL